MINFLEISSCLGSIKENNFDIEKLVDWSANQIFEKTGIKNRYLSDTSEDCLFLAKKALENLKQPSLLKKTKYLISVSNTGNNLFPGISNKILSFFEFPEDIFCINLNSGCTGFVDALCIADSLMKKDEISLIINVDTYTKYIKNDNRSIRTLFSDGASATIIKNTHNGYLITKRSFISKKDTHNFLKMDFNREITMNGPMVLNFLMNDVMVNIKNNLNENEKNFILCHQAGKLVINLLKKNLPNSNIITNYELKGNLVSASLPVLIQENFNEIFKYNKIILLGFGVGLSSSLIIIQKNF